MKKLIFLLAITTASCAYADSNGSLAQNLHNLFVQLDDLSTVLKHGPVPSAPVTHPLPLGSGEHTVSEQEKQQVIKILKDIGMDEDAEQIERVATQADFIWDLKNAMHDILKGFSEDAAHTYIGYPTYNGAFQQRFLDDFDHALNFLKSKAPHDKKIPYFESIRPALEKAVGQMPVPKKPRGNAAA